MLEINEEYKKEIEDISLANHLRSELTAFAVGAEGQKLLGPVINPGGTQYQVFIKENKPTATSGTRVTINPKETKIDVATKLVDLKEFVESTIFELTNATNSATFAALETSLKNGGKALRTYGVEKANCEAQASWNVGKILEQRKDYMPSTWGEKQIKACMEATDLGAFQHIFRALAHEADAAVGTAAALPTAEYYAFNGAYTVGGQNKKFDNFFTQITHKKGTGRRVSLHKLKEKLPQSNQINSMNMKAVTYYWVAIELLKTHNDLTVGWKHPQQDCEFTQAMKNIAADTMQYKQSLENSLAKQLKEVLD